MALDAARETCCLGSLRLCILHLHCPCTRSARAPLGRSADHAFWQCMNAVTQTADAWVPPLIWSGCKQLRYVCGCKQYFLRLATDQDDVGQRHRLLFIAASRTGCNATHMHACKYSVPVSVCSSVCLCVCLSIRLTLCLQVSGC